MKGQGCASVKLYLQKQVLSKPMKQTTQRLIPNVNHELLMKMMGKCHNMYIYKTLVISGSSVSHTGTNVDGCGGCVGEGYRGTLCTFCIIFL
jgi:hypothetical protein